MVEQARALRRYLLLAVSAVTWREQTITRILLIIARMLTDDDLAVELRQLSHHIAVHGARADEEAT